VYEAFRKVHQRRTTIDEDSSVHFRCSCRRPLPTASWCSTTDISPPTPRRGAHTLLPATAAGSLPPAAHALICTLPPLTHPRSCPYTAALGARTHPPPFPARHAPSPLPVLGRTRRRNRSRRPLPIAPALVAPGFPPSRERSPRVGAPYAFAASPGRGLDALPSNYLQFFLYGAIVIKIKSFHCSAECEQLYCKWGRHSGGLPFSSWEAYVILC